MKKRYSPEAGIAIGVILFAVAMLGIVAVAFTSGNLDVGASISVDKTREEIYSQANLIQTKIDACYRDQLAEFTAYCADNVDTGGGVYSRANACNSDKSVASTPLQMLYTNTYNAAGAATGLAIAVDSFACLYIQPGDFPMTAPYTFAHSSNLWTGRKQATLPPPPIGFGAWTYYNEGDSGGRCIVIQPTASHVNDKNIRQGLLEAAAKFSASEVVYSSGSSSQRFIRWITVPTGAAHANCQP